MIWHAVIWKAINEVILNNVNARWDELVEEVKVLSWRWLLSRFTTLSCMFYEWSWCPPECLLR
jgi:hypothetical protein